MGAKRSKRPRKGPTISRSKGKSGAGKRRPKKDGVSFELRARDALQYVHPDLRVEHNVKLPTVFGREQQFDVTLRGDERLRLAYEAKDLSGKVPIEKIQAFETKLADLAEPPIDGGGLVSSAGFQVGPIERTRHYGERARVRQLLQLREVERRDWQGRIRELVLSTMASTSVPSDVRITLEGAEQPGGGMRRGSADRDASFLYDSAGRIVGNLLDTIDDRIRTIARRQRIAGQGRPAQNAPEAVELSDFDGMHLRVDGRLCRVKRVEFEIGERTLDATASLDLSTAARDTLIDCLEGTTWIIPDPDRAITASREGFNVALTFAAHDRADLSALELSHPNAPPEAHRDRTALVANALQVQILLRMLTAIGDEDQQPRYPDLEGKLADAGRFLASGDYENAKRLYWATCAKATSLIALCNLAYIYQEQGDLDQALRLSLRAMELFPLEVEGVANAVAALRTLGRLEEAREVVGGADALHAGHPVLLRQDADLLFAERRYSEAAARFAELSAIDRSDARSRFGLAQAERAQGKYQEAAWDASEAWRIASAPMSMAQHVVRYLNDAQRFADALRVGLDALARTVGVALLAATEVDRLRVETAIAAYEAGDTAHAARIVADVEGAQEWPRFIFLLGLLQYTSGSYSLAYASFNSVVSKQPGNVRAARNAALSACASGLFAEAHGLLTSSLLDADADIDTLELRALSAAHTGNVVDAQGSVNRFAAAGGDAAELLVRCSNAAFQASQLQAGIALRLTALEHGSTDAATELEQALIEVDLVGQGRIDPAPVRARLERAERSGARSGRSLWAHVRLALHAGWPDRVGALMPELLASELAPPLPLLLATEAESAGMTDVCLAVLDRFAPAPFEADGLPKFARPEAVRAMALLLSGHSPGEVEPMIRDGLAGGEHPFHHLAAAYCAYAAGRHDEALQALDTGERLLGGAPGEFMLLRAQCLVEAGRYRDLLVLVERVAANTPLATCTRWGARNGDVDPSAARDIVSLAPSISALAERADVDHVVLLFRDGDPRPIIMPAPDWGPAFTAGMEIVRVGTPFLVRTRVPVKTMRRIHTRPASWREPPNT